MHILVAGYYGFQNIGDEAILTSLLKGLRESLPQGDITVLSGDPAWTSRTYGVASLSWRDIIGIHRTVQNADIVIIGGGGLFHDYWGLDPDAILTSNHYGIICYAGLALLSALYRKPLAVYAVGVGPLLSEQGRRFTKALFALATVKSVRDNESRILLESLGLDPLDIRVTADPAIALDVVDKERVDDIFRQESLPDQRPLIGVSLRNWDIDVSPEYWEKEIAGALDGFLKEHGGCAIGIPFQNLEGEVEDDVRVMKRIVQRMEYSSSARILQGSYSPGEIAGILERCDVVLGMRYHSVLFSVMGEVPVIALGYDQKVINLMTDVGCEGHVVDMRRITGEGVMQSLKAVLDNSGEIRSRLRQMSSKLREKNETNVAMVTDAVKPGPFPDIPRENDLFFLVDRLLHGHARLSEVIAERESLKAQLNQTASRLQHTMNELAWTVNELARTESTLQSVYNSRTWRMSQALGGRISGTGIGGLLEKVVDALLKHGRNGADGRDKREKEDLSRLREIMGRHDNARGIVIFPPTQDWNTPLFQRPQNLALELSKLGYLYFYATGNYGEDNVRGFQQLSDNLYLTDRYDLLIEHISDGVMIVPSTNPHLSLEDMKKLRLKGFRIVYDYIDEIHPHITGTVARQIERHRSIDDDVVDLVLTVSTRLYEEMRGRFPLEKVLLNPNGVDYEHFHRKRKRELCPEDMKPVVAEGKPIIGYYGALANWIDYTLIDFLAEQRPDWNIVIIGVNFDGSLDRLSRRENVHSLGGKPYQNLPNYGIWFDVAIIPFMEGEIAKSTSPIKLYEYMAMNKPVVVTRDLVECRKHRGVLIAEDAEDFIRKIEVALRQKDDGDYLSEIDSEARANTWRERALQIENMIRRIRVDAHEPTR